RRRLRRAGSPRSTDTGHGDHQHEPADRTCAGAPRGPAPHGARHAAPTRVGGRRPRAHRGDRRRARARPEQESGAAAPERATGAAAGAARQGAARGGRAPGRRALHPDRSHSADPRGGVDARRPEPPRRTHEEAVDVRREPGRPVSGRQARRGALQGRRVVHEERAARGGAAPAQGGGRALPGVLPRAQEAGFRACVPVGRRQLGAQGSRGGAAVSNLADSAEAAANGQAVILRGRAALLPEDAAVDDDLDVPVEARGYWEGVWLRLKRDKLALAGGVFIVLLFVTAFAGAPLASHFRGQGPKEPFLVSGGLDADQLPAGPWTHVGKLTESGEIEKKLFVLGTASKLHEDAR